MRRPWDPLGTLDQRGLVAGGGGGGSSSSTTTTQQTDERVAASDDAVVVQLGDGAAINVTDPEIWDEVGGIVQQYEDLLTTALGFAEGESDKANALVGRILDQQESEDFRAFGSTAKWAVLMVGIVAGAWVWSKQ